MDEATKKYQEELKAEGVDIPELDNPAPEENPATDPQHEPEEEPKDPEEESEEETEEEEEGEEDGDPEEKKSTKPRSIYSTLKDKKSKLKEAQQLLSDKDAKIAELEGQLKEAVTPEEKQDAKDEIEAFAEESGLDAEGLRKLQSIILKGVPATGISEEDKAALANLKTLTAQQEATLEKEKFAKELETVAPKLKDFFPNLSEKDTSLVNKELDRLAHTSAFADKELDYILYKNKDSISKMLSPKKRGLESKKNDTVTQGKVVGDFNTAPDFSKMTSAQIDAWEKQYESMSNPGDGLMVDSRGRKSII